MEREEVLEQGEPNWEYVKTFLMVARRRSFRAVNQEDGIAVNTARRHVDELEKALRLVLFLRNPNGLELTEDGKRVYESAERMERAARILRLQAEPNTDQLEGVVRIAVTEGLGTIWLMPLAVELLKDKPRLVFHIDNHMETQDLTRHQADMSIQLDKSEDLELRTCTIGYMHIMPFAARAYVEKHGMPDSMYALRKHRIVLQQGPQMHPQQYLKQISSFLFRNNMTIITNTSAAHFYAIRSGAGIGFLPTYAALLSDRIVPIDIGKTIKREIRLVFHPDLRRIKRVNFAIDWVTDIFDGRRYPWFASEFVHPNDLEDRVVDPEVMQQVRRFCI
jgi:DNA-binding transcriptional LysR family regulator